MRLVSLDFSGKEAEMKLKNVFKKKVGKNRGKTLLDSIVPAANNHSTARRAGDSIASQRVKTTVEDK